MNKVGSGITFKDFIKSTLIIVVCLVLIDNKQVLSFIGVNDFEPMIALLLFLIIQYFFMVSLEELYGHSFLNEKLKSNLKVVFFGILPMLLLAISFGTIYWYIEQSHTNSFEIDGPKSLLNFLYYSNVTSFSFSSMSPKTTYAKIFVLAHAILNLVLIILFINRISELISSNHKDESKLIESKAQSEE